MAKIHIPTPSTVDTTPVVAWSSDSKKTTCGCGCEGTAGECKWQ